jgi:hypothetical protein
MSRAGRTCRLMADGSRMGRTRRVKVLILMFTSGRTLGLQLAGAFQ